MPLNTTHNMGQTLQNKSSPKRLYRCVFFASIILTLLFLVLNTVVHTSNDVWESEGRAYETKHQDWLMQVLVRAEIAFLKKGYSSDSWLLKATDKILYRQYEAALQKIPADDFERLYWYHEVVFIPNTYGDKVSEPTQKRMLQEILSQLQMSKNFTANSKIISEAYKNQIVSDYASYVSRYQDQWPSYAAKKEILERVYSNAIELNIDKVIAYRRKKVDKIIFDIFSDAYIQLANNISPKGTCDREVAGWWKSISEKTEQYLINSTYIKSQLNANENRRQEYADFVVLYYENNEKIHSIARKCLAAT